MLKIKTVQQIYNLKLLLKRMHSTNVWNKLFTVQCLLNLGICFITKKTIFENF